MQDPADQDVAKLVKCLLSELLMAAAAKEQLANAAPDGSEDERHVERHNLHCFAARRLFDEIALVNSAGHPDFLALLRHDEPFVRLSICGFLLLTAPALVRPILQELADLPLRQLPKDKTDFAYIHIGISAEDCLEKLDAQSSLDKA